MADERVHRNGAVNTVLGPVAPEQIGVVAVHESLLSVVPGAQYAYDINIDRAEIFEILAGKLKAFKSSGGGTVVDTTGMFHGRDLPLLEALSKSTGVHIVASTGMGPEENLGGYFLTPQTNPPTPWPAEKFADLFGKEITDGMVIPRLERRQPAGVIVIEADRNGVTPTEISLYKGAAHTSLATGVAVSIRFGVDALAEIKHLLEEGLPANRIAVGHLDRSSAVAASSPQEIAALGAYVAIDHIGQNHNADYINDQARVALVLELIRAGYESQILLSANAVGVAKGFEVEEAPHSYSQVLTDFVPKLAAAGVDADAIERILVQNPANLLTVKGL